MAEVFGTDKLTMFSLNKVLTPHLTALVKDDGEGAVGGFQGEKSNGHSSSRGDEKDDDEEGEDDEEDEEDEGEEEGEEEGDEEGDEEGA